MRNEIVNPLFESLMKRAEMYVHPSISEASVDQGLGYVPYARTMITLVQELIGNFTYAISTYPPTKIARDFKKSFKTNLAATGAKIETTKLIHDQTNGIVLVDIDAEYTRFKAEIANEKEYDPKIFGEWLALFDKMMAEEKAALAILTKKIKEIGEIIGSHPDEIASGIKNYIKDFSDGIKIEESLYKEISYNSDNILENLSNNKVCVDFKTYSKILNEGIFDFAIGTKEERANNKRRKGLITDVEALKARLDSVMNTIAAARNTPLKNLKCLDFEATFNNIYKRVNSFEATFGEGINPKNVNWGEEEKTFIPILKLFNDKEDVFNKQYNEEKQASGDYANVLIAIPELKDHTDRADGAKKSLETEALKAMSNYKIKLSTDAAAAAEAAKKKKDDEEKKDEPSGKSDLQIKEPIKQGSKDKENIKKFQQLVVDKMKSLKGKKPYDNLAASTSQFGNFGNKTAAIVKYLKAGFNLKDKSSDITPELIDKISSNDGKINDSLLINEQFDVKAADASLVGSSSGSGKSSGGSKVNSSAFKCIKAKEGNDFKMKGGRAVLNRPAGNIHEFKADGSYRIFIKSENKWKKGVWSCAGGSYEATIEGGEVYLGDYQDFKSNVTKAQKAAADAASKKAAEFAASAQEICKILLQAMAGATEDEETVYKTFQEKITTKEMFNTVEAQWNSLWPSRGDMNGTMVYAKSKSWEELKKACAFTGTKNGFSFRAIFTTYFSSSEIARLNQYLPSGVKAI
jgi:hypothetical protein